MANDPLIEMLKSLSLDSGSVTVPAEPGTALLVDSTKSWLKDSRKNCIVRIIKGSGSGQQALIVSNSGQSLQVKPTWLVSLDTTSVYVIYKPEINAELLAILDLIQNPVVGLTALKALMDVQPTASTYSHPNGVGEQTAFTITATRPRKINTIFLDLVNLTQNAAIRVKVPIDGANYRTIETFNWTTGMDDGVYFREITVDTNVQVTVQSAIAEGAVRDIPYRYFGEK